MLKRNILIVDDDQDTLFMLRKRLQANGFECQCVSSVELAMESISKKLPDLILLDLMFQKTNGTALLQCANRFWPGEKGPPILVMSGCHEKEVVDFVLDRGAVAFIKKPIDSENLVSMLNRYVA